MRRPMLTISQILAMADTWYQWHHRWPKCDVSSGFGWGHFRGVARAIPRALDRGEWFVRSLFLIVFFEICLQLGHARGIYL